MSETETEPVEPDEDEEGQAEEEHGGDGEPEARCEAETTAGGNTYRCALQEGHEGEHSFQMIDAGDEVAEPEPEAAPAYDDDEVSRKLARKVKNYTSGLVEILGADLGGFAPCALCDGFPPGLVPPVQLDEEKKARVRVAIGLPALANYKQDRRFNACSTCEGLGRILTGSSVQGQEVATCEDCSGRGFMRIDGKPLVTNEAGATVHPLPAIQTEEGEAAALDPWGRPYGDPLYGVMPGYEQGRGLSNLPDAITA